MVVTLSPFCERIFSIKNILSVNSLTFGKRKEKEPPKNGKIKIKITEKSTIRKGAWDFLLSYFWIPINLAKYTYGWSPLEQHHKIENQNTGWDLGLMIRKYKQNLKY